jgi:hypothetical protein
MSAALPDALVELRGYLLGRLAEIQRGAATGEWDLSSAWHRTDELAATTYKLAELLRDERLDQTRRAHSDPGR